MPLIALDILETKIQDLLVIIHHLKEENERLNKALGEQSEQSVSPEVLYELDKLKETLEKYKKDRNLLYTKTAALIKQVDEMIEKRDDE